MIFILVLILLIIITITMAVRGGSEPWDCSILHHEPHYQRTIDVDVARPDFRWTKFPPEAQIALKQGQRKLLMNEIEFYVAHPWARTVIYAGAAAGIHQTMIAQLFPHIHFILYDPNPFYTGLATFQNIETHQEYFTVQICEELLRREDIDRNTMLFLSDIRTGSAEANVAMDMKLQEEWCDVLRPRYAMLKFRLPISGPAVDYYDGDIYLQPRCGPTSRETRLWTDCKRRRSWSPRLYSDALLYWQRQQRHAWHDLQLIAPEGHLKQIPGLDHCYDCWAETQIFQDYIRYASRGSFKIIPTIQELFMMAAATTFSTLNVPPHGMMTDERDPCRRIETLRPIILKFNDERDKKIMDQIKIHGDEMWAIKDRLYMPLRDRLINDISKIIRVRRPRDPRYKPNPSMLLTDAIGQGTAEIMPVLSLRHNARAIIIMALEFIQRHGLTELLIVSHTYCYSFMRFAELMPHVQFIYWTTTPRYGAGPPANLTVVYKPFSRADAQTIRRGMPLLTDFYIKGDGDCHDIYRQWMDIIQPSRALLALRLDGPNTNIQFYDGDIILPPYHDHRYGNYFMIDTAGISRQSYDKDALLKKFKWYKTWTIMAHHPHDYPHLPPSTVIGEGMHHGGLDHCHYCWRETHAWHAAFPKKSPMQISELILNGWLVGPDVRFNVLHIKPHGMLPNERNVAQRMACLEPQVLNSEMYSEFIRNTYRELGRRSNVLTWEDFMKIF